MANRNVKSERDASVQDKLQVLLGRLLQDDDNKYCVDCDSKGPRWASWNLGIFVCIRCAGIHRNLGVHISKVRSVNLDSWTPQQVASMQLMGNSRARAVYEANLPEDFKRPSTDAQVEVFIRAKYEKKKFIAKEWIPAKVPDFPIGWTELVDAEKQKRDLRSVTIPPLGSGVAKPTAVASPVLETPKALPTALPPKVPVPQKSDEISLSNDLFSLSVNDSKPAPPANPQASFSSDLLGLGNFSSNNQSATDFDFFALPPSASSASPCSSDNNNTKELAKLDAGLFDMGPSVKNGAVPSDSSKMSKDSILALFNKPSAPNFQQHSRQQLPSALPNDFGPFQANQFNNMSVVQPSTPVFGLANNFSPLNNPFLNQTTPGTQQQRGFQQNTNPNFGGLNGFNFP